MPPKESGTKKKTKRVLVPPPSEFAGVLGELRSKGNIIKQTPPSVIDEELGEADGISFTDIETKLHKLVNDLGRHLERRSFTPEAEKFAKLVKENIEGLKEPVSQWATYQRYKGKGQHLGFGTDRAYLYKILKIIHTALESLPSDIPFR